MFSKPQQPVQFPLQQVPPLQFPLPLLRPPPPLTLHRTQFVVPNQLIQTSNIYQTTTADDDDEMEADDRPPAAPGACSPFAKIVHRPSVFVVNSMRVKQLLGSSDVLTRTKLTAEHISETSDILASLQTNREIRKTVNVDKLKGIVVLTTYALGANKVLILVKTSDIEIRSFYVHFRMGGFLQKTNCISSSDVFSFSPSIYKMLTETSEIAIQTELTQSEHLRNVDLIIAHGGFVTPTNILAFTAPNARILHLAPAV